MRPALAFLEAVMEMEPSQNAVCSYRKALKQGLTCLRMYMAIEAVHFPLILAFILFVLGKGGELSIPNSCFTLRNTGLRCGYASKMPTVTAVFNKNKIKSQTKAEVSMAVFWTLGTWKCESGIKLRHQISGGVSAPQPLS